MPPHPPSSFDPIAGLYHRLWSDWYLPAALPALERLLFSRLPPPATLLDVCCGSGHVTRELVRRGYLVTGVDASQALLAIARRELPAADFQLQDITALRLPGRYAAALSTFDSFNHILTLDGLRSAFINVRKALQPGGLFVFDMNLREAFRADMRQWSVDLNDDHASLVRGFFDEAQDLARTELVWFRRDLHAAGSNVWQRAESHIEERAYPQHEILAALSDAGFLSLESMSAVEAGMHPLLGLGRIFVSAIA